MKVNSTELQNNFGKYLAIASREEIIVMRNGNPVAKLSGIDNKSENETHASRQVMERAEEYDVINGRKATFEEYLELTENSEERYEYIDGEIYLLASPKTKHQAALTELFGLFYIWFQGKACTPFVAPYDIELRRTTDKINMVQPDIMIICDLEEHLNEDDYYKGVPDLVVEILSKSTRSKDMIKKLDLYMSCGVREYWIVNPFNHEVTIYLFEDKNIQDHITYKQGETAHSFIFDGLTTELNQIFKT